MRQMVRWLMTARKNGRWGNTQENALAMEALVAYYRKYETEVPDFRAVVTLGTRRARARGVPGPIGRRHRQRDVPMAQVLAAAPAGAALAADVHARGRRARCSTPRASATPSDALFQDGLDSGFQIERRYAPYVENGTRRRRPRYEAGDLVRVTLTFQLTKERRYRRGHRSAAGRLRGGRVVVRDDRARPGAQQDARPTPAATRRTGARGGSAAASTTSSATTTASSSSRRGWAKGVHEFTYIVRATTAGTFRTAPARAEEMYEPEVFGRTATTRIEVKR